MICRKINKSSADIFLLWLTPFSFFNERSWEQEFRLTEILTRSKTIFTIWELRMNDFLQYIKSL